MSRVYYVQFALPYKIITILPSEAHKHARMFPSFNISRISAAAEAMAAPLLNPACLVHFCCSGGDGGANGEGGGQEQSDDALRGVRELD